MSTISAIGLAIMFAVLGLVLRKRGTINRTAFWLFVLAALLFLVAAVLPYLRS